MSKFNHLPPNSGVYLMLDEKKTILYIGKAKNLKKRVQSYFTGIQTKDAKTRNLLTQIQNIEFIATENELESLLLENTLIKKHKPKFNILLKDDKTFPYILIDSSQRYPRIDISRKSIPKKDLHYFGPFVNVRMKHLISSLNHIFKIRDCDETKFRNRTRPCLNFDIGQCSGPCVGFISEEDYRQSLENAKLVLGGQLEEVSKIVNEKMIKASENENFELAAMYRDQLHSLMNFKEEQNVTNLSIKDDQDIVGFYQKNNTASFVVLNINNGSLTGKHTHIIDPVLDEPNEYLEQFLFQLYKNDITPKTLLLPNEFTPYKIFLEEAFLKVLQKKIKITSRSSELNSKIRDIAKENAKIELENHLTKTEGKSLDLLDLQEKLGLSTAPDLIECYDISNLQGEEIVASKVVCLQGIPAKNLYRKYIIRNTDTQDDFESIKEVIERRFSRPEDKFPDLIVIDGGSAQLNSAHKILKEKSIDIPVIGLAKARTESDFKSKEVTMSSERIFIPGRKNPIILKSNSGAYRILTSLRNEAHRFAIKFHRERKRKKLIQN